MGQIAEFAHFVAAENLDMSERGRLRREITSHMPAGRSMTAS
jgi:hypothetical protein